MSPAPEHEWLLNLPQPPGWMRDALCTQVPSELFFPEEPTTRGGNDRAYARAAKKVCARCPVTQQCLDYALAFEDGATEPVGVYGGMTARDRRHLLKERRNNTPLGQGATA